MPVTTPYPTLRTERRLWSEGADVICGIDEVGRGSWAGPVTVGALVAPPEHLTGVRDSKLLNHGERVACAERVRDWAVAFGVGHASHTECDEEGMTEALRRAARRALEAIADQGIDPDVIVLDGSFDYIGDRRRVRTVVKADQKVLSVSAASVMAKVTRDALMEEEAEHFPAYGFESNRGYPAPLHRSALAAHGPCTIHRQSWVFMEGLPWCGLHRTTPPRLFAV